ncbi:MAG: hypothetical protein JSV23_05365 [Promethearchaeota archaeon]|nr:MAG: hypothetical protein JSV23_05365 [Candidatus Lokiarchaeota archaeon]
MLGKNRFKFRKIIEKKIIKTIFSALIIISSSLLGSIAILSIYEIPKEFSGYCEISSNEEYISEIEIDNQIQVADINFIQSTKNSSNILEVEWIIIHKSTYNPEEFFVINYEKNQSILKVSIYSRINEPISNNIIVDASIGVFLNPNYIYGIKSYSGNSDIKFTIYNINFSIFEIETNSGNVDVIINMSSIYNDFKITTNSGEINLKLDHISFSKDFTCITESGHQYFDFWNIWFLSKANLFAFSSSGRIYLYWANHFKKSQEVKIFLNSKDKVFIKLWSPIEIIKYDVFLYSSINGTTRFIREHALFEEIESNHYQSINFNNTDLDFITIKALTSYSEAHVRIVNCFKWKRDCNWQTDVDPYEVETSGDYVIPREDHNVTTVELYNLEYIFLNEMRHLDINFQLLSNTSKNIIYLNWDLTYWKAMGYGNGSINIKITNKTEVNSLKVYIELQYELDLILPTFSEYNFTVFYHPNYNFYNYTI